MSLGRIAMTIGFLVSVATVASAAQRTFVSAGTGSDANSCTRLAPCRNFARAMEMTDSGGEVIVLDSGGYGTVTIDQAVSLVSPSGVYAGITAFSGNAITIDPDLANESVVRISGLTLNGLGGTTGVDYSGGTGGTGTRIFLKDITATGFISNGLNLRRSAQYFIHGARVSENGNVGIELSGTETFASHATLTNVVVERNLNFGVLVDHASVAIRDSSASNNGGYAFYARGFQETDTPVVSIERCQANLNLGGFVAGGAAGTAKLSVSNSIATMNSIEGVSSYINGTVQVANTTSTYNAIGLYQGGGAFYSLGNNNVLRNGSETTGTITPYTAK